MRLLVTGGCGFVGSNFIRYVLEHYQPEMITNVDALTYAGSLASTRCSVMGAMSGVTTTGMVASMVSVG